jgi:hypothetical protein
MQLLRCSWAEFILDGLLLLHNWRRSDFRNWRDRLCLGKLSGRCGGPLLRSPLAHIISLVVFALLPLFRGLVGVSFLRGHLVSRGRGKRPRGTSDNPHNFEMNSEFTKIGGLAFRFRKITPEQLAAENAADTDDVIGLTASQSELRNRATNGEQSQKTNSTSELLAETLKRVSAGKGPKKPDVQVTEKVTEPALAPEATHAHSATSDGLAAAIRKARGMV